MYTIDKQNKTGIYVCAIQSLVKLLSHMYIIFRFTLRANCCRSAGKTWAQRKHRKCPS